MKRKILKLAEAICGTETDAMLLEALCDAAERELRGKLRDGVRAEDCADTLCCACAFLAAAAAENAAGGEDFASFRAGDLSITAHAPEQSGKRAALLREQAMTLMAPYCRDSGFAFCGVCG